MKLTIRLILTAAALAGQTLFAAATIRVDSASNVHPISRYLYGMQYVGNDCYQGWCGVPYNIATTTAMLDRTADLRIQVMRQGGGNNSTKYNWVVRATGHPDYCDYQYPHDYEMAIAAIVTQFHVAAFPTAPMLGLVSGTNAWECWDHSRLQVPGATCANAATKSPAFYVPTSPTAQTQRMSYLDSKLGKNAVKFWCMDNEPMIWGATHDDVFSSIFGRQNTTFMDYWTRYSNYAAAMKKQNPGILCVGPEECNEWYWFYSMSGNESLPFYEWFIMKCADYEKRTGKRILDVLSFHFYPDTGAGTSTVLNYARSMWDPAYDYPGAGGCSAKFGTRKIQWIRRLKAWIEEYFTGTPLGDNGTGIKLGFTETDFGGSSTAGLLYADFIGVFSREGLSLCTPWQSAFGGQTAAIQSQYYYTMWMYTHFFGDTSVECNIDGSYASSALTAYASLSSSTNSDNVSGLDGKLCIAVLNRASTNATAVFDLDRAVSTNAELYQYRTSLLSAIKTNHLSNFGNGFSYTFPPRSFSIIVATLRDPVRFTNFSVSPAALSNSRTNMATLRLETVDIDGTVTNVSVDLTSLNGAAKTVMTLTNTTGSTSFWKCVFSVSPGLPAGLKVLAAAGMDSSGFRGTARIAIPLRDTLPPLQLPAPMLQRSSFSNVVVSWQPAADETAVAGYVVLSSTNPGYFTSTNTVGSGAAFTDRSPHSSGKTWYFAVIAFDAASNRSAVSPAAPVTIPLDRIPPQDLLDLTAVDEHGNGVPRIVLSWRVPVDPDLAGIIVLKSGSSFSDRPDDGWTNYSPGLSLTPTVTVLGLPAATAVTFIDTDVRYGESFFYRLFTFDAARNYSGGAGADVSLDHPVDGTVKVLRNYVDGRKGEDFCRIHFEVAGTNVKAGILIYNSLGEKVRTLESDRAGPGIFEVDWDLKNDADRPVSSGTYFCIVTLGQKSYKLKIIIVR